MEEERLRRYYLTVLGIDPWCARWPLPGAAPSPECPPAVTDTAEAAERPGSNRPDHASRQPVEGRSRGVSLEVVREALSSGEGSHAPALEGDEKTPSESQASLGQAAFNAMIWHGQRFSLMAAVTGDYPHESRNRLGRNILGAMETSPVGEGEVLRWPPFDNPELPGREDGVVEQFVERLARGSVSRQWVLLGEELYGALVPALQAQGHVVAVSAEHTLGDLLSDPSTKPTLWQRLKPLVDTGKRE